jgi:glutamyl-tRNA reductase
MSLIASHRDVDLDLLERLCAGAPSVGPAVAARGAAAGAVVLATCNRFEVYLEVARGDTDAAAEAATAAIADAAGLRAADVVAHLRVLRGREVPAHLFAVAAGLESMVVGEREVSGQVRRALIGARAAGTTSSGLDHLFQTAARASRQVARTGIGGSGRSVVGVALDLAEPDLPAWACTRVVLVGTGAYAGASLAALHRRGCHDVRVYSPSGRAPGFAAARGARAVPDGGLARALATTDLVVACSGTGGVLDAGTVAAMSPGTRPRVVVDLALSHDVEPAVGALPGVRLIDLRCVREQPGVPSEQVDRARLLVAATAEDFAAARRAREHDGLLVAQRRRVLGPVEAQAARVYAGAPTADRAVCALRRRTRALLHAPTVRARAAARAGDEIAFGAALAELAAIPDPTQAAPGACADRAG